MVCFDTKFCKKYHFYGLNYSIQYNFFDHAQQMLGQLEERDMKTMSLMDKWQSLPHFNSFNRILSLNKQTNKLSKNKYI